VNQRDSSRENSPKSPLSRGKGHQRQSTNLWNKKPSDETYDERKERLFKKVSLNNLDVSLDFTKIVKDKKDE
jgi:hypothetical protein